MIDTILINIEEINPIKDNIIWKRLKHWVLIILKERYARIKKFKNVLSQFNNSISILF